MPDLLEDLRRYGDAVEAAALDHDRPPYAATDETHQPGRRRPSRRAVLVGVAAAVLVALVVSIAVLVGDDDHDSVRIDTPPTSVTPTTRLEPVPATVLPASDGTWTPLDPGPLSLRGGASAVWTGSELLVWGGVDTTTWDGPVNPALADGAAYDPARDRWTMLPPAPIEGRGYHTATWSGSEMLVFGGGGPSYEATAHVDGAAYDPAKSTWRTLAPAPLPLGPHYEGTWSDGELFVVGTEGAVVHAAAYHPQLDHWTVLGAPELTATSINNRIAVAWVDTRGVVLTTPSSSADPAQVLVFDVNNGDWASSRTPQAWWLTDPTPFDGTLVSVAKAPIGEGPISYDPGTNAWENWRSLPGFSCEGGHQLERTGDSIFATACGTSGFYDPDASTWQPATSPGAGLAEHIVWTGDELLWLGFQWVEGDQTQTPSRGMWSLTP